MPRRPRVFVEGGIYHVYNRFASGEPVFADPEEALEFIELLRYVKKRDGWTEHQELGVVPQQERGHRDLHSA